MARVSLQVKYLSNRNYVRETSVEGKHTGKFFFTISFYDDYYVNGKCILFIAGNLPGDVATLLNKNFGSLLSNNKSGEIIDYKNNKNLILI